jgi:hypothetical protein
MTRTPHDAGPGSLLENMSSRPTTVVTHRSTRKSRQVVPSLRVQLRPNLRESAMDPDQLLPAFGVPTPAGRSSPKEVGLILGHISTEVITELRLPGVIPLAPSGSLPGEESCEDPLLALAVLTRCSGPVWLRDRAPALERLANPKPVRLLVQPGLYRRILERISDPGWRDLILWRARMLGVLS